MEAIRKVNASLSEAKERAETEVLFCCVRLVKGDCKLHVCYVA